MTLRDPPVVKGALPLVGHMIPFGRSPFHFMLGASREYGEIVEFRMFHKKMILLTGEDASEFFFKGRDEDLDQSAAYGLMTPIFGKGILFDAPVEKKNRQLKMLMPALRDNSMRTYAGLIEWEAEALANRLGEGGQVELVALMKELTIYTASHCLLGPEIRFELNDEFSRIYHDLEQGVSPIAYINAHLPLPSFRRRDRARTRLQELVTEIVEKRKVKESSTRGVDMFQILMDARYDDGSALSPNEITGILIGAIFAGHHTSSGTLAWVLIELLKRPDLMRRVKAEVDEVYGAEGVVDFDSLRRLTELDHVIKEVLRLHPPLILLMRMVMRDLEFKDYRIAKGKLVCIAPPVTHRMPELFPDPEAFDPDRYAPDRAEDENLNAWQPFGGGRHRCSGNAFAIFQIKTILAVLLRRHVFELVDPLDSYCDDYTQMIVQPASPCRIRYRERTDLVGTGANSNVSPIPPPSPGNETKPLRIHIDMNLCQGHAVCMGEAPELFHVGQANDARVEVLNPHPNDELVAKARRAAKFCPTKAIALRTL